MKKFYFKFKVGLVLYYDNNSILSIAFNYLFVFFFFACVIFYGFCCKELGYWYPNPNSAFDIDLVYSIDIYINFFKYIVLSLFICHLIFYIWFVVVKFKYKDFYKYVLYCVYRKLIYKDKKKTSIEDYEYFLKFSDRGVILNGINVD